MTAFEIFGMVLLILYCAAFAVGLWILHCNSRTYRDRKQRLRNIEIGSANFRKQMDLFQSVSYNAHLRARILFQDPDRLYENK